MNASADALGDLMRFLQAEAGEGRAIPPVERWNPERCVDGAFEIAADGVWRHEGTIISRPTLVRLFSTILRTDADGSTWLVTPHEKVSVAIEDAAFLAIRADRVGSGRDQTIALTTNVGDVVAAGPERPIRVAFDAKSGEPRPYVLVRGRLEARILRGPFYELASWSEEADGRHGVWSGGAFFPLEPEPG